MRSLLTLSKDHINCVKSLINNALTKSRTAEAFLRISPFLVVTFGLADLRDGLQLGFASTLSHDSIRRTPGCTGDRSLLANQELVRVASKVAMPLVPSVGPE